MSDPDTDSGDLSSPKALQSISTNGNFAAIDASRASSATVAGAYVIGSPGERVDVLFHNTVSGCKTMPGATLDPATGFIRGILKGRRFICGLNSGNVAGVYPCD